MANAAAKGAFQSGATAKALQDRAMSIADTTKGNYITQLPDVANRGTAAKSSLIGQGTNLTNTSTALQVGGRYICGDETSEAAMIAALQSEGLRLSDSGQCEIVGFAVVAATTASILNAIDQHRLLAAQNGYRLEAVEAGEPGSGSAVVLASEPGYVPWWSVETNGSFRIAKQAGGTRRVADICKWRDDPTVR